MQCDLEKSRKFNPVTPKSLTGITTMKQKVFTTEFYKKMFNELIERVSDNDWYFDKLANGKFIGMDYEAEDGTYLTFEVQFDTDKSWHAPTFDPRDEYCTLDVIGIAGLVDVKAYESSDRDSEELTGFDTDAFFKANENV